MVKSVKVPWAAWYGDPEELVLEFPDEWDVQAFPIADAPPIDGEALRDAVTRPLGTEPLAKLARGKRSVAVAVEDISRPSRLERVLNLLLDELEAGCVDLGDVTVVTALGAHRPMNRFDLVKKLGSTVLERVNVENHHPYENLVELGHSAAGTPIHVNRTYHDAELKVAVGTVIPHPLAGFGGGAKMVLPGVCGIETLAGNHEAGLRGVGIGLGVITELRRDVEDVCSRVGLDFSVNLVTTSRRQVAGAFAGHFVEAHRAAVDLAKRVYRVEVPRLGRKDKFDAGIFNLFPEDTELSQSIKGMNLYLSTQALFRRGAVQVFASASPEGRGFHSLSGERGARLYKNWGDNPVVSSLFRGKPLAIFSPGCTEFDVRHFYPPDAHFCRAPGQLVDLLAELAGASPKVAVFPTSLGLPELPKPTEQVEQVEQPMRE
ncbi:MAG: hypothetical protein Kow0069_24020 [Promethearchaeota archaeon]